MLQTRTDPEERLLVTGCHFEGTITDGVTISLNTARLTFGAPCVEFQVLSHREKRGLGVKTEWQESLLQMVRILADIKILVVMLQARSAIKLTFSSSLFLSLSLFPSLALPLSLRAFMCVCVCV